MKGFGTVLGLVALGALAWWLWRRKGPQGTTGFGDITVVNWNPVPPVQGDTNVVPMLAIVPPAPLKSLPAVQPWPRGLIFI